MTAKTDPNSTFSPLTCLELMNNNKLDDKQVTRELKLLLTNDQLKKRDNENKRLITLKNHFNSQVLTDNDIQITGGVS